MKPIMSRLPGIPPLVAHDRLTRAEFERRYAAMPENVKAELLDGVVYVAQAARHLYHGHPQSVMNAWLTCYEELTPGVEAGNHCTLRLPNDNEPQPDLLLRKIAGSSLLDAEGHLVGAPELVVEITASTASYDLHDKLDVYCRFGVQEYVVYRVTDGEIDWFVRTGDRYVRHVRDEDGCYKSAVFPGLCLDVAAVLRGDLPALRAAVVRGLRDPEHARFVQRQKGS